MTETLPFRRDLLITSLCAALPLALAAGEAEASKIDPAQTIVRLPDQIAWKSPPDFPEHSVESAPLFGSTEGDGLYLTLVRWWPGYMSAPHAYVTDRLCVVVSGTWWVNSGADFDPGNTIPAPAGTFVRRVAHTPHYDGVKKDGKEPAIIAICGMAPVHVKWFDPKPPRWRRV
ncbi:MAG: hypothetical protein J0I21_08245 [Alphaproteobacteria bacterium]|nr:hypothetical protein [Alphaproteobacteria bacterium]